MRGTEIILRTRTNVVGGGKLHAYLGYTGYCTQDMSGRNENILETNPPPELSSNISDDENLKPNGSNEITIKIYPNPLKVTESNLLIEFSGNKADAMLTDLMGREVCQFFIINGINQIKLPIELKGLYILKIIDNNEKKFAQTMDNR
jgi:hypothetical protein